MHWYRSLTKGQRRILALLTLGVLITIGLLAWSVVRTLQAGPPAETPAPTTQTISLPTPTPTAALTQAPSPTVIPTFDVTKAGEIAAEVAEVRGFQGFWGTPLTLVDQHNLSVALFRYYAAYPPFVTQFEVIWDALNLRKINLELTIETPATALDVVAHAENAAAIYFPETEEFYFRRDWTQSLDQLEMQLVYGYARAMPDQYGNITALIAEATTLDRRMALSAVGDGDALHTLWLYAGADANSKRAAELSEMIAAGNTPQWKYNEPTYDDLSRLPLDFGAAFAAEMVEYGGLQALDEVILRPPRSTEQILHIDRYLDGDEPRVLMPLELQLGRDWTMQASDTLGEALIGFVLNEWSTGQYAYETVENWGGDLLQVWGAEDGSKLAVWQLIWDTSPAAVDFYRTMLDLMPRPLLRGIVRDTTPSASLPRGRWWAGAQGAIFLYRRANRITLIWGSNETAVEAAASELN